MTFKRFFGILKQALKSWGQHKCLRLGASLAFYTLYAIAPLFLIALAIAGFFFGKEAAQKELFDQLHGFLGQQGGQAVQAVVASARKPRAESLATTLAVITLFVGATAVFVELQDALNTIWQVRRKAGLTLVHFIKVRLISFAMMLVIGFLLLVSLVISAGLAATSRFVSDHVALGGAIDEAFTILFSTVIITVLFALIFKVLPDVKISWRDTWLGALMSAVLFEGGKFALGLYLAHSSLSSTYGAAGSLVILLMWVYYSSQTLFFGAEFTRAFALEHSEKIEVGERSEFIEMKEDPGASHAIRSR